MDVIVRDRTMEVLARRDIQAAPKRPEPDCNQRDANDAFSPGRQDVRRWKQVAERDRQQRHDDDARCVAEPPRPSRKPRAPSILESERSDSG